MPATLASLSQEIAEVKELLTELLARSDGAPKKTHSTINEFCAEFGFSRSHYLNLRRSGEGPRETMAGSQRPIITDEDKAAWKAQRQALAVELEEQRQRRREARAAGEAPPFRTSPEFRKPRGGGRVSAAMNEAAE